MPVVSVILPVYNGASFLREAIDSVLAQTFTDFELIVIDDGSTDATPDILGEYTARDTRVRVKHQPCNMGIVEALNSGCQIASGEYFARMDADDICLPQRLARQIDYLTSHPEVGVVGTDVRLLDPLGKTQETVFFPKSHGQIYWSLCFYNPIAHPTVMMRRDVFFRLGGYRKGRPEDYDLWMRAVGQTRLANLPEVLLLLRKHTSNLSIKHEDYSLPNCIHVADELLTGILGKHISEKTLEILQNPYCTEMEERWQAATLLKELSNEFIRRFIRSQEEKDFIIKDTASRLAWLALRKISFESVTIISRAITYNPFIVFRILTRLLWKRMTGIMSR
jgi:glycosyltransferase involved in cell wall biosynthesis